MDNNTSKKVKMQLVIITCYLFGTTFGNSFFGIDFKARPEQIVNTGFGEIYRVFRPNVRQRAPLGWNSNNWNINDNQNSYFVNPNNPSFNAIVENLRVPQHQIHKLTQDHNQISDTRIPIKKLHGPDSAVPSSLNPQQINQNTGASEIVSNGDVVGGTGTGSEYIMETSLYETPTNEDGEIGGPPPAIVASLLG